MNKRKNLFLLSFPCTLILIILFLLPMIYIFAATLKSDGTKYFYEFFTDSFYIDILINTIVISIKTTIITLILGYPTAYFLAKTKSRFKNILIVATIFPFLVSSVVRSYGWMVLLGNKGFLNQFLQSIGLIDEPIKIMYTSTAVLIGLVHLLIPYMVLSIASVIQAIDKNLGYAASSLGSSPLQTFFKVTLPLSAPGVISGCILVFTLSMTAYVTPKLLGGAGFKMMSTMVYQEVQINFNWHLASAISFILLFIILIFQICANIFANKATAHLGGNDYE